MPWTEHFMHPNTPKRKQSITYDSNNRVFFHQGDNFEDDFEFICFSLHSLRLRCCSSALISSWTLLILFSFFSHLSVHSREAALRTIRDNFRYQLLKELYWLYGMKSSRIVSTLLSIFVTVSKGMCYSAREMPDKLHLSSIIPLNLLRHCKQQCSLPLTKRCQPIQVEYKTFGSPVHLPSPSFSHGYLYVTTSRVRHIQRLQIFLKMMWSSKT